ncbi:MAG: hypothetical protein J6Q44_03435 [Alphaproteobacteria bacterium]|nr:hypothetical protein [Alphaproteobacteria bacterium]
MSAYYDIIFITNNEPQYVRIRKKVYAHERFQDHEIFRAHVNKREGLLHLVARYHEIGKQVEKEMSSIYPCAKTIAAKFTKRNEVAGILARQGIVVQDQMDKFIIARYQEKIAMAQSVLQPTKQK